MWRSAVQLCAGLRCSPLGLLPWFARTLEPRKRLCKQCFSESGGNRALYVAQRHPIARFAEHGGLAQLARAPALQAGGQRFESVILHRRFPYGVPDTTCWGPRRNRKVVVGKAKARVAFMPPSGIRCDALPHAIFDVLNELEV